MSHRFSLVGIPSSMGAFAPGQEKAPAAFRSVRLMDRLTSAGVAVVDDGDSRVRRWFPDRERPKAQHVHAVTEIAAETAARVRSVRSREEIPIVLGGDCTIGLGTIAGVMTESFPVGVVYFDLHTDMNVPASVREGALDWMGMAHALAFEGTERELREFGPRTPLLEPDDVVFFGVGAEQPTPYEREQQQAHGLREIAASAVASDPEAAARSALGLLDGADRIVVHFDVDTIDYMDLPLSENAGRNEGVTLDVTMRALRSLLATPKLAGLTVAEVNPDHDPDGSAMERLTAELVSALAGGEG